MEKTTKEFKEYVLEVLNFLSGIVCKPMMGEYLLYYKGTLFGGIYNNRVLIKRTESNKCFQLEEQIPYKGAKPLYFLKDLEEKETVEKLIVETVKDLQKKL